MASALAKMTCALTDLNLTFCPDTGRNALYTGYRQKYTDIWGRMLSFEIKTGKHQFGSDCMLHTDDGAMTVMVLATTNYNMLKATAFSFHTY